MTAHIRINNIINEAGKDTLGATSDRWSIEAINYWRRFFLVYNKEYSYEKPPIRDIETAKQIVDKYIKETDFEGFNENNEQKLQLFSSLKQIKDQKKKIESEIKDLTDQASSLVFKSKEKPDWTGHGGSSIKEPANIGNDPRQEKDQSQNQVENLRLEIEKKKVNLDKIDSSLQEIQKSLYKFQGLEKSKIDKYVQKQFEPYYELLNSNSKSERDDALEGIIIKFAPFWADYFALRDIKPSDLPQITIIPSLANSISNYFENIRQTNQKYFQDRFREVQFSKFTPEEIKKAEQMAGSPLKELSTEDISSFVRIFKDGGYNHLAGLLDNNTRNMYAQAVASINKFKDFIEKNKTEIQELLLSFKRKISIYKDNEPKTVLNFSQYGIESISSDDKNLFKRIPLQENPFEEINKFVMMSDLRAEKLRKSSSLISTRGMQPAYFEPGLAFIALFKASNGGNNDLSSLELDEHFLKSAWGQELTSYIKYNTPMGQPNDIRAILEVGKFLREDDEQLNQAPETVTEPASKKNPNLVRTNNPWSIPGHRDYLSRLIQREPDSYAAALFAPLTALKNEIVSAKTNKEGEKRAQLEKEYGVEKQKIFKILSPILKDYMAKRYLDTTLIETQNFLLHLIQVYDKALDNYDPNLNPNIQEYLIEQFELYRFNRKKTDDGKIVRTKSGGQDLYYGPLRLFSSPKTEDELKGLFDIYRDLAGVNKTRRYLSDVYETKILSQMENEERVEDFKTKPGVSDLRTKSFKVNKDKRWGPPFQFGKKANPNYNPEEEGSKKYIPIFAKMKTSTETALQYEAYPAETLLKNPERARAAITKANRYLIDIFSRKLKELRDKSKEAPERFTRGEKGKYGDKTVFEPDAASSSDMPNKGRKSKDVAPRKEATENILMDLLQMTSTILKSMNITEEELLSRLENNLAVLLQRKPGAIDLGRKVVKLMFKGQFRSIFDELYKGNGKSTTRANVADMSDMIMIKIIELCTSMVKESEKMLEEKMKEGDFSEIGSTYMNIMNTVQEQILSGIIHHIAAVRPGRKWKNDNGGFEGGEKNVYSINTDSTTSILDPNVAALADQDRQLRRKYSNMYMWEQNQDPTSDTRQTALQTAMNVVNRYTRRLQLGEPHYESIQQKIAQELDRDIKMAFKNQRRAMKFGNTKWTWGFIDYWHKQIVSALSGEIISNNFRVEGSEWFNTNPNLRHKAIEIFSNGVEKNYKKNLSKKQTLAPKAEKGQYAGMSDKYQGPSNTEPQKSPEEIQQYIQTNIELFTALYPEYLDLLALDTQSLSEIAPEGDDRATMEEKINAEEVMGYTNDVTIIFEAVRTIQDTLTNKCFLSIQGTYGELNETQVKTLNGLLKQLHFDVNENPDMAQDYFEAIMSTIQSSQDMSEVVSYKFFEYIYIREVLLARLFFAFVSYLNNKEADTDEIKTTVMKSFAQFKHLPELITGKTEKSFVDVSDISIQKVMDKFLGEYQKFLNEDIAKDLIRYIGNSLDTSQDDANEFVGFKKGSETQGSVHGGDIKSSPQEDSNVSKIDKKLFSQLRFNNIFKEIETKYKEDKLAAQQKMNSGESPELGNRKSFISAITFFKKFSEKTRDEIHAMNPDDSLQMVEDLRYFANQLLIYLTSENDENEENLFDSEQKELIKILTKIKQNKSKDPRPMFEVTAQNAKRILELLDKMQELPKNFRLKIHPAKTGAAKEILNVLIGKLKEFSKSNSDVEQIAQEFPEIGKNFDDLVKVSSLNNTQKSHLKKKIKNIGDAAVKNTKTGTPSSTLDNMRQEIASLATELSKITLKTPSGDGPSGVKPKSDQGEQEAKGEKEIEKKKESDKKDKPEESDKDKKKPKAKKKGFSIDDKDESKEEDKEDKDKTPVKESNEPLVHKILSIVTSNRPINGVVRFDSKGMREQGNDQIKQKNARTLASFIFSLSKLKSEQIGEYVIYNNPTIKDYIVTQKDKDSQNPKDFIAFLIPKSLVMQF